MNWSILGISPTKDKKAITGAYRQKLRQTNPEDKPEEFKALRAAYEEALALADRDTPDTVRDESPVGRWLEAVQALYWNYAARIDPEQWRSLLADSVCTALDTRPAAEEALLRFFMENYFLPRPVWVLLEETFHFSERAEELYEAYPREFIDHVILSGPRAEPLLSCELFIPGISGEDCDAYRRLYIQATQTNPAECAPILAQMDALSEKHPYGEALRFRMQIAAGQKEEGTENIRKLAEAYPGDTQLNLLWADLCLADGLVQEAEAVANRILEQEPEQFAAKNLLAQCLAAKGMYHEAKELIYTLMHASGGDPILIDQLAEQMKAWNEMLIQERTERLRTHPDDTENAIELAWCYAQTERPDDALEIARGIDPHKADTFSYHNLMGKLCLQREDFPSALPHLQTLEEYLRNLTPDGTEETAKQLRRLPEMLQIQGSCLMQMQETEAAREKLEQALALAPEDPEVLTLMSKIVFSTGDYPYTISITERLLSVKPDAWYGELLLSLSYYYLHQDKDAFDAINRALAIQSYDLSLYVLKLQLLIRNGVWEEVHAILDFLSESGAPKDIFLDYVHAQITEMEQKDPKKAFGQYQAIARRVESGETLLVASELYFRMAVLMSQQMHPGNKENRELLIAQLDKGLQHNAQDMDCLAYKAQLLKQGGQLDEAIAMYRTLEAKNPHAVAAQRGLAELYYENLERYAQEALAYYERLLQTRRTPELYFYLANCKRYMQDMDGARQYFLMELEMDPEDVDGYRGLALICDTQGKYDESLAHLDRAISIMESYGQTYMWLLEHKVQVLRRLGRFEQALAFVDDIMQRYSYDGGFQLKFDICCQFALWDRAKQILSDWKSARKDDPFLMAATARLHLFSGKLFKAAMAMGPAKHRLPPEQILDFRLQLADMEHNPVRQVQIWDYRAKQDPEDSYAMMNLAMALWHSGRRTEAQKAAEKALALLDGILAGFTTEEALFRSRRSVVLALLGKAAEAKADLEAARKLPLCHHCEYCACKDADVYEAAIQEILGNREAALALYRAGKEKWPDELDFVSGEDRLKRKDKRNANRN